MGTPPFGLDAAREMEKKIVRRMRTDFLIQFVWQPPKPEEQPKNEQEQNVLRSADAVARRSCASKFKPEGTRNSSSRPTS